MKKTTQLMAFILLLSSLLFGDLNNHSVATEYKLLNSVKLAHEHKNYVDSMSRILKSNFKEKENFNSLREQFNKVLNELAKGDKVLKLDGDDLRRVKMKLSRVQRLWSTEQEHLEKAFSSRESRLQAINTIDKLNFHMRSIASVYTKSYIRYTQNAKPSHFTTKQTLAMR